MMKRERIVSVMSLMATMAFLVCMCSGCCALLMGSTGSTKMESTPSGAFVFDEYGNYYGQTPCEVTINRQTTHMILRKEGCSDTRVAIDKRPAIIPFIFNIPLVGWYIDVIAMNGVPYYLPNTVKANVLPDNVVAPDGKQEAEPLAREAIKKRK